MAIRDYLVPLLPAGVFSHPLRADMLAGHLCWHLARSEGEGGARGMIEAALGGAFRISDPLPHGFLPLPMDEPEACVAEWRNAEQLFTEAARGQGLGKDAGWHWHSLAKRARKLIFIRGSAWRTGLSRPSLLASRLRGELAAEDLLPVLRTPWEDPRSVPSRGVAVEWNALHTAVNRLTHGAEAGTLHERTGVSYAPGEQLDVYLRCDEGALIRYVGALASIGMDGHLKHASSGWGRFTLGKAETAKPWERRAELNGTRAWVSLSPCVPEEGYSGKARYRLLAHYGKLGGNASGKVFKRAVVLLATGATFTGVQPRGCWLEGVHEDRPETVHYAFAYPLPC